MARARIVASVDQISGVNGTYRVVEGATVNIYQRGSVTPATVYTQEVGGTTLSAPFTTNAEGRIVHSSSDELWVDAQSLDISATKDGNTWEIPYEAYAATDTEHPLVLTDFGGVGDGSTDNADAFAAAFAALPDDGGELVIPPGHFVSSEEITPPSNTKIRGLGPFSGISGEWAAAVGNMAGATDAVIHGESGVVNVTVESLGIVGHSVADTAMGIRVETSNGWVFRDVYVEGFDAQGFKGEGGTDLTVENMWLLNCCRKRTGLSSFIGVFQHDGPDAILHNVRATASIQTDHGAGVGGPGSGYIAGIWLQSGAANAHMTACYGHLSQTGMVISASRCHISSCRSDINEAGGWVIEGSYNRIMGCSSYRDGQGADVTYDGMTLYAGNGNVVAGFQAEALNADSDTLRHGIVDACSSGLPNQIIAPQGIGIAGSVVYDIGATVKPVVQGGADRTTAYPVASAAALDLPAYMDLITISGTTNITSIVKSHAGRLVTLVFQDALTFTDGSNLKLNGNFVTTADDSITLRCDGTNWIEVSRSTN